MRSLATCAAVLALATVVSSCSGQPSGLAAGERCVRTAQCGDGLACVAGVCSRDVGPLMESGMVPDAGNNDAGPVVVMDGAPADAPPGIDAGPGMDAGPDEVDAGPDEVDAGPPEVDSGPPEVDSGPPEVDSGPPEADSGPPTDAGT